MMGRRHGLPAAAAALLLAVALLATGTAAGDPGADKARVDSELERLRGRAADADRQAGVNRKSVV